MEPSRKSNSCLYTGTAVSNLVRQLNLLSHQGPFRNGVPQHSAVAVCAERLLSSMKVTGMLFVPVVVQLHELWEVVGHNFSQQHCRQSSRHAGAASAQQVHGSGAPAAPTPLPLGLLQRFLVLTSICEVPCNVPLRPRQWNLINLSSTAADPQL
jgi:hypothetical protein